MVAKLFSGTIIGLSGVLIEVEVDVANRGFPTFTIVGLPNKAVDEAKERVRASIVNSSLEMPDSRITVNLAPADIPKIGSGFDLPIALGVLAASKKIQLENVSNCLFIGELSLHGKLRSIPGVISIAMMAKERKIKTLFLPKENAPQAAVIQDVEIIPLESLNELILHIKREKIIEPYKRIDSNVDTANEYEFDFLDIKGQDQAKRALQIAAAGFHNIHLRGVPGAGKTMLCRAFPSILPPLDKEEVFEVSKIYSAVGLLDKNLVLERPFRAPHHTTSRIGLIGGGAVPTPGEISLAHRGVLFLDELPEFPRSTIEALRQPMEDGTILISRASGSLSFPCRFLLLSASNPCPCGYYGHPKKACTCHPTTISLYHKKLSGPLLDRIDMHIDILPVEEEKLSLYTSSQSSREIKANVMAARAKQRRRFANTSIHTNSEMQGSDIKTFCRIQPSATSMLRMAVAKLNISARSYFKLIKVAQTIVDLAGLDQINADHISEALQYRQTQF